MADERGEVAGLRVERALGIQGTDPKIHLLRIWKFGKVEGPLKSLAPICVGR